MVKVYTVESSRAESIRAETGRAARTPEGRTRLLGLIPLSVILLSAALAIYLQSPPAPLPESAPPADFSAARAMKHLRVIARSPHPVGSTEHDAVRDYLIKELNALGLSPEVQRATAVSNWRGGLHRAGTVENVVARLRGSDSQSAVLLAAHYDSAPHSPGASDDGYGVAALLETARALKAEPPPRNDVLFLFTDGEEVGLLGAEAFVARHPSAKDVGVVLNFEARGSGGPVIMFETSENNGWLIKEFAGAAPHPVANSLSYEVYKRLPNDTDLTVFKRAGLRGLNFASINQLGHYHTAGDSVENVDESTLQSQGSYVLSLARRFGSLSPAGGEGGNAVYFNLLGPVIIHYPQWLAAPLAALAALLFVGVVALGLRRRRLRLRGVALGFVALLLCGGASWLVVRLAWGAVSALHRDYDSTPWGDVENGRLYAMGFVLLAVAISSLLYNLFRRWADTYSLAAGALAWWALLAVGTSLGVPGASYLFTWPLLFASIGIGILFVSEDGRRLKTLLVLAVYAIPGVILLAPLVLQVFDALTLAASATVILLVVPLLGLLFPHLDSLARPGRWLLPGACTAAAAGLILSGLLASGSDRSHPKAVNVFYALDADTGAAVWGSADRRPNEWTEQFVGAGGEKDALTNLFPLNKRPLLKGTAPSLPLPAPQVVLLEEQTSDGTRTLRLRITSPRGGAVLYVYVEGEGGVVTASVNGEAVKLNDAGGRARGESPWGMTYYGLPEEGAELTLAVNSTWPVKLRVDDRTYGLPRIAEKPFSARPDDMIPSPSPSSDMTIVSKSYTF